MGIAAGVLIIGAAFLGIGALAAKVTGAGSAQAASPPAAGGVPPGTASMGQVRDYLMGRGLTRQAASGVVGNLWQESGGDPKAAGGGLAQWIGDRWTALVGYAQHLGLDPGSMSAQLGFLVQDLHGSYSSLLGQLNAASSPSEAAQLFSNVYERPGNPQMQNRIRYAEQAYAA